ncbi:TonB-dependent receptor [candidate division KSB1 bacterium]|nr:TonB-dependent receptor [candidate division KSB1 bacterium]
MKLKTLFKVSGFLLCFTVVFSIGFVQAANFGETGKIAGRVVDGQTGDPIPGANVIIEGTTQGAATDINGYYTILKMRPGTYTVVSSVIGYKKVRTTNVQVSADLTTTINFNLEITTLLGEAVTIVSERPLVIKDMTSSSTRITAAEIEDLPNVSTVTDAISLMPGIVGEGEEIHARGGRSGEVVYLVDGMSVNDPLFNSEIVSIGKYAVQEIELLTGGFQAEYGNTQSGVVNIITRGGGPKLSGRIAHFTDHITGSGRFPSDVLSGAENPLDVLSTDYFKGIGPGVRSNSFNSDRTEFNLGGPEPITNRILPALGFTGLQGKVNFFISGTAFSTDGYLPNEDQSGQLTTFDEQFTFEEGKIEEPGEAPSGDLTLVNPRQVDHPFQQNFLGIDWGGRFRNDLNYSARVSYRVNNQINTSLSFTGSQFWRDSHNHNTWKWLPERTTQTEGRNSNTVFSWSHTLSPKTFYQVKIALLDNFRETYPGMRNGIRLLPDAMNNRLLDGLGADFGTTNSGNPDGFLDAIDSADEKLGRLDPRTAFNAVGYGDDWSQHDTRKYSLKVDYLTQFNRHNEVKIGFNWDYSILQQQQISDADSKVPSRRVNPPDNGPYITSGSLRDFYIRYPNSGAVYIQDKIEFESLIANIGFRFDRFDAGAQVFEQGEAFLTEDSEKKRINTKNYFSPRLGLSHPITDRSRLYFFYGRFVQIPTLSELYRRQNRFRVFQNQLNTFGNPDLEAEETISYEIGFDHQLTDDLKIGVTGFYKDIRNQINSEIFGPEAAPFRILVNKDYGQDRGFEFDLIKRFSNYYAANINYTLMWATARSSTFNLTNSTIPYSNINEINSSWDQRHTINANIRFELPAGRGIDLFGTTIDRASLTLFWRYGSGQPFTLDSELDPSRIVNNERLSYFSELDLRFRKDFKLMSDIFATFYLDVNNLFNRRNVLFLQGDDAHRCITCTIENPETNVLETKTFPHGNIEGDGTPRDLQPNQLGPPRQILFGFGLRF